MYYPTLLNIIEIGSVPLSFSGKAAPSIKNRGANNCETFFIYKEMYTVENSIICFLQSFLLSFIKGANNSGPVYTQAVPHAVFTHRYD